MKKIEEIIRSDSKRILELSEEIYPNTLQIFKKTVKNSWRLRKKPRLESKESKGLLYEVDIDLDRAIFLLAHINDMLVAISRELGM